MICDFTYRKDTGLVLVDVCWLAVKSEVLVHPPNITKVWDAAVLPPRRGGREQEIVIRVFNEAKTLT